MHATISEADSLRPTVFGELPWKGMWTLLKWSTHHGSFVVSTQKKPPIF